MLTTWIQAVYQFLWGDLLRIPLPGGSSFGVSLLIILLILDVDHSDHRFFNCVYRGNTCTAL